MLTLKLWSKNGQDSDAGSPNRTHVCSLAAMIHFTHCMWVGQCDYMTILLNFYVFLHPTCPLEYINNT